jgi:hypothetical protein
MEHRKLANGREHKLPIRHSPTPALRDHIDAARPADEKAARKKTARKNAQSALPRKEVGGNSKSDKLVCRYCGSDDLAPSFVKRRDRRCRKCFSKRYGSVAGARKAKVKK